MKALALLLTILPVAAFGQMTANYSSYVNYAMDSNFNVYQTVVVDGQTDGSCYYTYPCYCGQSGCSQCQGTYGNCVGSVHTPSINNVLNGTGGWSTGPSQDPFTYMSYQTTISANIQPGQEFTSSWAGQVVCSGTGVLLATGANPLLSIKVATYALSTVNSDGSASYHLSCPANTTSTCGTANLLGSSPHLWAEEFTLYSNPGGCWFINIIQYLNGPPAPYPCT